jgi:hypothetical protein
MDVVVALKLTTNLESTEVSESIDICDGDLVVILRKREVKTGARSTCCELDHVIDENGLAMVAFIRACNG